MVRRSTAAALALMVLLTALAGCARVTPNARCKSPGAFGENGAWVYKCTGGRWRADFTKADGLRLLEAIQRQQQQDAAAATTTTTPPPAPTAPPVTAAPRDSSSVGRADLRASVLALINAERAAHSREPLSVTATNMCTEHEAREVARTQTLAHVPCPAGVAPSPPEVGVAASDALASGSTAGDIVVKWMSSPDHRAVIMNSRATVISVGVACSAGGVLVTSVTVGYRNTTEAMTRPGLLPDPGPTAAVSPAAGAAC